MWTSGNVGGEKGDKQAARRSRWLVARATRCDFGGRPGSARRCCVDVLLNTNDTDCSGDWEWRIRDDCACLDPMQKLEDQERIKQSRHAEGCCMSSSVFQARLPKINTKAHPSIFRNLLLFSHQKRKRKPSFVSPVFLRSLSFPLSMSVQPNPHPPPRHRVILLHPSNKLNRANSGGRACRLLERKRKRNRKKKKKRRSSHQLPLARHAAKLESKCLNGQINLPIRGSLSAVTGDA
ncbi:hypothetical protein HDK77DRAFT_12980 [Phyllosticta capitalensis]